MSFYEVMGRKMRMLFANHPLTYVSTEGEAVIKECQQEEAAKTVASSIPVKGVDMGNAILAMHSCRETGSVADHEYCVKAFTAFYGME